MFGGALGELLPFAVGIAISPIPIIACILMLFSARGRVNGLTFLLGWVAGITVVTVVVVALADSTASEDVAGGASIGDIVLVVLGLGAIALGIRQWRDRPAPGEVAAMPTWMSATDSFSPAKALAFGFLLSALNPKNLGLALAAGLVIDQAVTTGGNATALVVLFVVLASLSVAVPVAYLLVGGDRAKATLDGWRTWLAANSATVMAILFLVIGVNILGSGLDGLVA